MTYINFILGLIAWFAFAYDIEYDRDFMTWMWLIAAILLFVNSYIDEVKTYITKTINEQINQENK